MAPEPSSGQIASLLATTKTSAGAPTSAEALGAGVGEMRVPARSMDGRLEATVSLPPGGAAALAPRGQGQALPFFLENE